MGGSSKLKLLLDRAAFGSEKVEAIISCYPKLESSPVGLDKNHNHVKIFFEEDKGFSGSVRCTYTYKACGRFGPFIYSLYGYEQGYSNNIIHREGLTVDKVRSGIREITYMFLELFRSGAPPQTYPF